MHFAMQTYGGQLRNNDGVYAGPSGELIDLSGPKFFDVISL
jgi:hypothetical protein